MVVDYFTARHRLAKAYEGIDRLAATFTRDDLLEFSRCRGWVVADVLFHLLCDAQRALIALASPYPGPSDRDFVSYGAGVAPIEIRSRARGRSNGRRQRSGTGSDRACSGRRPHRRPYGPRTPPTRTAT
ncbi:MAG TPA: maleylpyruvate isomerase N-terminal domain-containing protein [Micromonosporaceae bacterium]